MRRSLALFVLAVVLAAPAAAGVTSRKPETPDRTFYLVAAPQKGKCALSLDPGRAESSRGCGTRADAATGSETVWFPALDGLPLSLDVTRPIHGTVTVHSRYLVGWVVPSGGGVAQLTVTVAGTAGGKEVTVGTFTSEPYTVTPDELEYEVEFRIDPDEALAGDALTDLRLGPEVTGPNVHHNLYYADARSTMTLPIARQERTRP